MFAESTSIQPGMLLILARAPCSLLSVATPHLGAWRLPVNLINRAFNYLVPVTTSRSGYQIMLQVRGCLTQDTADDDKMCRDYQWAMACCVAGGKELRNPVSRCTSTPRVSRPIAHDEG